jgi:hypothetical protein
MKIILIFLILFLTSCVSSINKLAFSKKLKNKTEVQLIKGSDFKIDISDYKLGHEIDSIMNIVFYNKNIKLINSKAKYVLFVDKLKYQVFKQRVEAKDTHSFNTGQFGNQLNISLQIESRIIDTLTGNSKSIIVGHEDIKIVSTDFIFDFFAVDSENTFSPAEPLNNCFNAMSHKAVNFINKQK